jgi:hypothetical protein
MNGFGAGKVSVDVTSQGGIFHVIIDTNEGGAIGGVSGGASAIDDTNQSGAVVNTNGVNVTSQGNVEVHTVDDASTDDAGKDDASSDVVVVHSPSNIVDFDRDSCCIFFATDALDDDDDVMVSTESSTLNVFLKLFLTPLSTTFCLPCIFR